jgi:hypothetical protein
MAGLVATEDQCLMHMSTTQCSALRSVFDVCARLIIEGTLVFHKEGLRMDVKSHILYVSMYLPAEAIDQYLFNATEPISCDINFKGVYEKLKFAAQDDIVTFQYTKTTTGKHTLLLHVQKGSGLLLSWELGLLMLPSDDSFKIDWAVFDRKITMDSSEFQLTIRAMHQQGEYMQLLCSRGPTYLFFVCCSLDADLYVTVKCEEEDEEEQLNCNSVEAGEATITVDTITASRKECDKRDLYSTRVLSDIAQASNGGKAVELFLKPETPLGMKFAVGTLGHILFCLACQVDPGKVTLEECVTGKASKRMLALAPGIQQHAAVRGPVGDATLEPENTITSEHRQRRVPPSAKRRRTVKPKQTARNDPVTSKPTVKSGPASQKRTAAPTRPFQRQLADVINDDDEQAGAPDEEDEEEEERALQNEQEFE